MRLAQGATVAPPGDMSHKNPAHLAIVAVGLLLPASGLAAVEANFASIHEKILVPKCLRCHGQNGLTSGGVNYSTYDTLIASNVVKPGNPEESVLFSMVDTGRMPQGGPKLPDDEILAIREWIAAGALNDGTPAP
jgi:cytochrome c553